MEPAPLSKRQGSFGPNSDYQERKNAEEYDTVENLRLMDFIEVCKAHNSEEIFCKSLLSILVLKEGSLNYFFFPYGAPNQKQRVHCLALDGPHLDFTSPISDIFQADKIRWRKSTLIGKYNFLNEA